MPTFSQVLNGQGNFGVLYNTLNLPATVELNGVLYSMFGGLLKINPNFYGQTNIGSTGQFGTSGTTGILINPNSVIAIFADNGANGAPNAGFNGTITSNNSGLNWHAGAWTGVDDASINLGPLGVVPVSPNQLIGNFSLGSNLPYGTATFNAPVSTSRLPVTVTISSGNASLTGTAGGQYVLTPSSSAGSNIILIASQPGGSISGLNYSTANPTVFNTRINASGVGFNLPFNVSLDYFNFAIYNTGILPAIVTLAASLTLSFNQPSVSINNVVRATAGQTVYQFNIPQMSAAMVNIFGGTSVGVRAVGTLSSDGANLQLIGSNNITSWSDTLIVTNNLGILYTSNPAIVTGVISPFTVNNTFAGDTITVPRPIATSGLRATLSVQDGPATISDNGNNTYNIQTTAAGTVTLVANQTGSGWNILAAAPVTSQFFVTPTSGVNSGCGIIDVSAGSAHGLALFSNGTITGWGRNDFAQATGGRLLTGVTRVSAGDLHSLALLANGRITGWGFNNSGQASLANSVTGAVGVSAGSGYSLALLNNGLVIGFGNNTFGAATGGNNLTGRC